VKALIVRQKNIKSIFRVLLSVSSFCTLQMHGLDSGGYLAVPSLQCRKLAVSFFDILGCM